MRQIWQRWPRDPTMGKSSGWIYEGHAPLMAKRGRRGDKRRRLVGAVVILGLTLTVVMTARTASGGSSPSAIDDRFDDFATHGARFGGGSRDEIRGDVRLHRFGSDADAASAATQASRAMDSMNSLTVGAAADRGVEMMRDHRRHEPSRGGGLRTTDHPIHLGIDDDVHRAVDFSHRPLVSHGGGWESQPLIESRIRHRDCGVSQAAMAAATANDAPHVDASPADAARWFRRFWEPCVSCADEEQIGGEPVSVGGGVAGGSDEVDSDSDSPIDSAVAESLGGRWVCDPERMIATPESDAEFKARVEQERRASRGAHGWLHSLGFGGGGSSNSGESSKGDGASHIGEKVGCVVLTVGVDIANSRGGFAFERDMRALYGCEVHVFDAMAGATPPDTADADAFDDDGVGGGGAEKKPRAAAGGSMTFTAGVSLASTSTAPTAVTKPLQTGKRRRAAPMLDDDDDDEDEEEDEEFRGESGDDDAAAKRRSNSRDASWDADDMRPRKQTTHSAFLSGGDSRPLTDANASPETTYSMTLPEMIDVATRGSASRSKDGTSGGHHALVDVVRIACDGCELDALTTPGASRALKERVKQLLLEVRYVPGDAPFVVRRASSSSFGGGKKAESSFSREVDDGEDGFGVDDADVAGDDSPAGADSSSSDAASSAAASGTAGLWRSLQVDAGMLPFHKEVEIVDVSREHHVGHHGGSDPLRKGVTVKRKSVGFFGSLFGGGGGGARGGRRGAEDLRPVVEYGLINERMVRKTKGRAGTRDW